MRRQRGREAIAFSTGPGQALAYQIGKLQITQFLAEARLREGDKFNLRAFHDFVWKNGNVPVHCSVGNIWAPQTKYQVRGEGSWRAQLLSPATRPPPLPDLWIRASSRL